MERAAVVVVVAMVEVTGQEEVVRAVMVAKGQGLAVGSVEEVKAVGLEVVAKVADSEVATVGLAAMAAVMGVEVMAAVAAAVTVEG